MITDIKMNKRLSLMCGHNKVLKIYLNPDIAILAMTAVLWDYVANYLNPYTT